MNPGEESTLRTQDIVDRLDAAGLGQDDAQVYLHLTLHGTLPAAAVAKGLSMSRAAVYRVLGRMTDRGFVTATPDHPTRFAAAPVDRVFQELIGMMAAKLDDVQALAAAMPSTLASLRATTEEAAEPSLVRVLRGRRDIYLIVEMMVREAATSLEIVTTHPGGPSMAARMGAWRHVREKASDDIALRGVLGAGAQEVKDAEGLEDLALRFDANAPPMTMVIKDGQDTLLWITRDPSDRLDAEGDTALWTNDAEFVSTQQRAFQGAWDAAESTAEPPTPAAPVTP